MANVFENVNYAAYYHSRLELATQAYPPLPATLSISYVPAIVPIPGHEIEGTVLIFNAKAHELWLWFKRPLDQDYYGVAERG